MQILTVRKEALPAARLIGKCYQGAPNWEEWWQNGWFETLEKAPPLAFNGDAYLDASRLVDGRPQNWVGMLFPAGTAVPPGFDHADIAPGHFAVCQVRAHEGSSLFYAASTREACLAALHERQLRYDAGNWCFSIYRCPLFTTPDADGNVILELAFPLCG